VSCVVFGLVSVAVADLASFRLVLLLLDGFVCVHSFLSTNLSSFLLPGCRLLLLLCCLVYVVCFAAWSTSLVTYFWGTTSVKQQATGWVAGFRFPAGAKDFSFLHSVQTGPTAHPDVQHSDLSSRCMFKKRVATFYRWRNEDSKSEIF
jgi:hypothetical protein